MSIETRFDISLVAALALKEKQIQQNYRPIIAVHKWFARRPGTLFRGLILSEFGDRPLRDVFFQSNDFPNRLVVDPFMGGGTPIVEANRVGCNVIGLDVNPMSAWIVREEIEHLNLDDYAAAATRILTNLEAQVRELYQTTCPLFGDENVPVKYFLWVKVLDCDSCGRDCDLFPGYLLADNTRHPRHVVVCRDCGQLNEVEDTRNPGTCGRCRTSLQLDGPARRGHITCPHCGKINTYPRKGAGPLSHRLFAIEYFNSARKNAHQGRFFKQPDAIDLAKVERASRMREELEFQFVPEDVIRPGDETNRLIRWGYRRYRDLFNDRQLVGLELSCQAVASVCDVRVRNALSTNLSDLLRYQNMLCRYDTMALKSLDIFSVHGFPVGLVQCESNLLGIVNGNGVNVGSGGWRNVIDKYHKAKQFCDAPFEIRREGKRKFIIPIEGEWIGEHRNGHRSRSVDIQCESSTNISLEPNSVDAAFTDPPYFGNVQYGELMEFCYVWLKRLGRASVADFSCESTRSPHELTGNQTASRDLSHFAAGLSEVYSRLANSLKPGAPLAFTFHHNHLSAYQSIGVALLDAGFICTTAIPCPAEMGGSIHIHGTNSSIVDTIFVCRLPPIDRQWTIPESPDDLIERIQNELRLLAIAGLRASRGDIRCILFGHLTRTAILALHACWDKADEFDSKLARFQRAIDNYSDAESLLQKLSAVPEPRNERQGRLPFRAEEDADAVSL